MRRRPHGALRRRWRRVVRGLRSRFAPWRPGAGAGGRWGLDLVSSPRYVFDLPGGPADPLRAERIVTWLARERLVRRADLVAPRLAPWKALRRVHSDDWLESLRDPAALVPVLGFAPTAAVADAFVRLQRLMTGGTIAAAERALSTGRPVAHLGGGFHHAARDRGAGFCVFNDLAAAVAALRERGFAGPVLIVDLDLHDGEGTRRIFARDPTVFTFSMHNRHRDDPEALASLAIEFGAGIEDDRYLDLLRRHLPPVVDEFRPRLVLYVAGTDVAAGDRLGDGRLSAGAILERDRLVFDLARRGGAESAFVTVLGGGYGTEAWRLSAATLAFWASGERLEPPPTVVVTVDHYRELSAALAPGDLDGRGAGGGAPGGGPDWVLTTEELMADLGGSGSGEDRFLGFYTEQGIELTLEQSGLLDRLRAIGFEHLVVRLDPRNPAGQTLRVLDEAHPDEPLIELRARRDRRALEGFELLDLEWLLLQNPALRFSAERPALPGQRHPGLGISEDILALLVLACERLRLDGILFVPSHFHLAQPERPGVVALDPGVEGKLRALRRRLAGMPGHAADAALARGEIRDATTGRPVAFEPAPMIAPVSRALRRRFAAEAWRAAAGAAEREWAARLGVRLAADTGPSTAHRSTLAAQAPAAPRALGGLVPDTKNPGRPGA